MGIPDHLVCDTVDVGGYRCDVLLDVRTDIGTLLEALLNLGRMQSMVDKVLQEGSLVSLLVGLIESDIGKVLL